MQNTLSCKRSGDPKVHGVRWQDATKAKKMKLFQWELDKVTGRGLQELLHTNIRGTRTGH